MNRVATFENLQLSGKVLESENLYRESLSILVETCPKLHQGRMAMVFHERNKPLSFLPVFLGRSTTCPVLDHQIIVNLDVQGEARAVLDRQHSTPLRAEGFTQVGDFEVAVLNLREAVLSLTERMTR